jgi:multidrug resistance efflux pump
MRGKWLIIPILVVLAVLVSFAVSLIRSQGARKAAAVKPPPAASAAPAEISLPVRIQAQQTVWVKAQISGDIEEFFADVGQEVYQGQVLAKISNKGLDSAHESASAALENAQARVSAVEAAIVASRLEASRARADAQRARTEMERTDKIWRRQKMLLGEGATPRLAYQKSEKEALGAKGEFEARDSLARRVEERVEALNSDLQSSKKVMEDKSAQLDGTQEQLKAAEVVSPVSGMVVARKGEAGKPIGEDGNTELFQIAVNTALLEAVLEAHPSALARLAPGQSALLFFADIPGEGLQGMVAEIKGDQARITFASPNPLIKPGMTAQVRITLR